MMKILIIKIGETKCSLWETLYYFLIFVQMEKCLHFLKLKLLKAKTNKIF